MKSWSQSAPSTGEVLMLWVTRERPETDRIACPWLIRRFIDQGVEIRYGPAGLDTDALGPGLLAIGSGLLAIGVGGLEVEPDDQQLLAKGSFVYDALYAWCERDVATS
jgi:hypothetical protein